ncbi:protein fuzzy homolog [Saccoglossus kowalevskii]|uniref:Protein fuzzy homolog n=1 Tax=Saccoglossus kowalevskii TaxID=10224 RepID=A0ABM0M6X9_SACKO|nr:PREDICTED: protein fuzzy homolog [Saccoglossus kowalevskii]
MAAYLVCLTADGGVPLFTRTKGNIKPLAFAEVGMLNGVQMFAQNHGVKLQSTATDEARIAWKVYHESITLIVVICDDGASDTHLYRLLDNVFHSMVLLVGLDDIISIKNVERLKRDLKACYKLVDTLLEETEFFGDLTESVDIFLSTENSLLQEHLESFVHAADSTYGCLCVMDRIAVATTKWWDLTGQELVLLSLLLRSLPQASSRDIAVYLPHSSPKIPHRLLTFQLIHGVEACVLCGPTPTLDDVRDKLLEVHWKPALESLRSCIRVFPRNIPLSVELDLGILGFILINTDNHRCLATMHPNSTDEKQLPHKILSMSRKIGILKTFYKTVVGIYFAPVHSPDKEELTCDLQALLSHKAKDTYICGDDYKCYALNDDRYQIFVLYGSHVPTFALRTTTQKTLMTLIKDKKFDEKKKS